MKTLLITLVCIICGSGFLVSVFQIIDIVRSREWLEDDFYSVFLGQALMMAGAIIVAYVCIKEIRKL